MPEEILNALIKAGTLIIGATAAYIAQRIYAHQKEISATVDHATDQNESICQMIRENTRICQEMLKLTKAQEPTDAESGTD
jgi:hypothetical protein